MRDVVNGKQDANVVLEMGEDIAGNPNMIC